MATLLTVAAVTAAVTAPAPRKKSRRESIEFPLSSVTGCGFGAGHLGFSCGAHAGFAHQRHFEVGLRNPEIAQRFDIAVHAGNLGTRIGEQLEHADDHAVGARLILLGDAFAQRHYFVTIVLRNVETGTVALVGLAHFGAGVYG